MKRETLSPTISTLLLARAAVEANWCQGFGRGNQVCAIEALWKPGKGAYASAVTFLEQARPTRWPSVMAYNDAKGTIKADILALYDRAIDLALKAEQ
jgi:hypothetical protein